MKQYDITSPYYIVIKDNKIIESSLPEDIDYHYDNQHIFTFSNKNKLQVHIVYIQDEDIEVKYILEENTQLELIETRILKDTVVYNRSMILKQNSQLYMFNENNSMNNKKIYFKDDVKVYRDALCKVGYGELSQGSVDACYHYDLMEEGADVKLRMSAQSKDIERKYYKVEIVHLAPRTYGNMDNYGVVYDKASLVIDGIGRITKGQHGSESHQTNKIIVFDELCSAKANPYLFIDEYDVKASHAAAVGKMDEEHLFYLQSRGLTKDESMKLITYGYLRPVTEIIDNEVVKQRFEEMLLREG